jgi:hypothetical protein
MPALDDDEDGGAATARLGRDDRFPPDRDRQQPLLGLDHVGTTPSSCLPHSAAVRVRTQKHLNHARKNWQEIRKVFNPRSKHNSLFAFGLLALGKCFATALQRLKGSNMVFATVYE